MDTENNFAAVFGKIKQNPMPVPVLRSILPQLLTVTQLEMPLQNLRKRRTFPDLIQTEHKKHSQHLLTI